jgi:hypothetical protein
MELPNGRLSYLPQCGQIPVSWENFCFHGAAPCRWNSAPRRANFTINASKPLER